MPISRQVTITGNDTTGYLWSCGTCGNGASGYSPSRAAAWDNFDLHYTTSPSTEVDQWLLITLSAGKALADAATAAGVCTPQVTAWTQALVGAPMDVLATWRNNGATHPQ